MYKLSQLSPNGALGAAPKSKLTEAVFYPLISSLSRASSKKYLLLHLDGSVEQAALVMQHIEHMCQSGHSTP
jgi:hypothetical protein